jgi:hypothetical protein
MQKAGKGDLDDIGFEDIDGFSDTNIYAGGGHGDLWKFNGESWRKIRIPTNVNLEKICCATDGKVYITTNANLLIVGVDDRWELIEQDVGEIILEEIVCYNNTVYVSSDDAIYKIYRQPTCRF